jgi:hypothetical protein
MNGDVAFALVGSLALAGSAAATAGAPSRPVEGPMLVCLKYSTFQLAERERVTDFSGSVESMSLTVEGPRGTFEIGESEIWAEPVNRGRAVLERQQTAVYQLEGEPPRYHIFGYTSYSPDEAQLVVTLSGDALRGSAADQSIYRRFEVRDPERAACGHQFTYG